MVRREGGMGQGFPYLIERFLLSAYCWKGKSYSIRFKDKMLLPVDSVTFISSISSDDRHPQLDSYPKRVTYNQCFGSVIFFTDPDPDPTQKPKADPDLDPDPDPDPGEIFHAYNKK